MLPERSVRDEIFDLQKIKIFVPLGIPRGEMPVRASLQPSSLAWYWASPFGGP
jgi:hypothetical protein